MSRSWMSGVTSRVMWILFQGYYEFRLKICRRVMKKSLVIEKSSCSALDQTSLQRPCSADLKELRTHSRSPASGGSRFLAKDNGGRQRLTTLQIVPDCPIVTKAANLNVFHRL